MIWIWYGFSNFQYGVLNRRLEWKVKKTSVSTFISSMEKDKVILQDKNSEDIQEKTASKIISRNDLCPCGSGKKYKNCHGR